MSESASTIKHNEHKPNYMGSDQTTLARNGISLQYAERDLCDAVGLVHSRF